ncbi:MAG: glycosyltransferase family 4 protein [Nitriliruptoraceae bacterium]|nr:glycosyltransferase family 4 protein [Nitriliruptoraceae bacterium]
MRVALVCPYDLGVPGGVQTHVLHLAAALQHLGNEVVVLGPGRGSTTPPRWAGLARTIRVPFNGSVAPISVSPFVPGRTRRALAQLRPEVIHVHEPMVPAVGPAALQPGIAPVVATFHAFASRPGLYGALRPLTRRYDARLAVRLAVSAAAAGFHARALGRDPSAFPIVPNGVDLARFAPAQQREPTDPPTLLFVGRLEPRKGADVALAVWRALLDRGRTVRLHIVGDGPARPRLERAVPPAHRGLVTFAGRVSDDALLGAHRRASCLLAPARGGESFGIVLLEALAAGTPVVASDLPGYRSVVTDGRDGALVAPGDVPAWAARVARVLDDPEASASRVAARRRPAARAPGGGGPGGGAPGAPPRLGGRHRPRPGPLPRRHRRRDHHAAGPRSREPQGSRQPRPLRLRPTRIRLRLSGPSHGGSYDRGVRADQGLVRGATVRG